MFKNGENKYKKKYAVANHQKENEIGNTCIVKFLMEKSPNFITIGIKYKIIEYVNTCTQKVIIFLILNLVEVTRKYPVISINILVPTLPHN